MSSTEDPTAGWAAVKDAEAELTPAEIAELDRLAVAKLKTLFG
jgi:hypothetical protein